MTQISFSLLHWLLFLSLNFNQFLNTWPLPCLWASIKPWLVIGWLSHRSWVPLSPFHKSLPRAPQSLLLLFSKLSPICHHIYCFESQNYTDKSRFCSSESHRRGWWWTQEWESLQECQQWHCLIFFHFVRLQTQDFQSKKSLTNKFCLDFLLILPSQLIAINS